MMNVSDLTYSKVVQDWQSAMTERQDWEVSWRDISDFLVPGRGIYQTYTTPRKRKLTSSRVVNPIAEEALYVMTSGMHGGLTSPSTPWFTLEWPNKELNKIKELKLWIQDATSLLHDALHASNFYSTINSFYTEFGAFATATMYVGSDSDTDVTPFRFELPTVGEYCYTLNSLGQMETYFRTLWKSKKQIVDDFSNAPEEYKAEVAANSPNIYVEDRVVLEAYYRVKYQNRPITRVVFEITNTARSQGRYGSKPSFDKAIHISSFDDWPYPLARWQTIGPDIWGSGPGMRVIPLIKRLQEMEKTAMMAMHKDMDPPLAAPARMKGQVRTLPGALNYMSGPNEKIDPLYRHNFNYEGAFKAIERVEMQIQKVFYNDIFLTAARDPNASPYKAFEVQVREQEKMLRLGPVIERLYHEFFQPLITRCFNIMLRKELIPPVPESFQQMVDSYQIRLTSPLAKAQRGIELQSIQNFLGFIGQAASVDQRVLDKLNLDAAVDEYADITGVKAKLLNDDKVVKQIRDARAQQQQQQQQKEEAAARAQIGSQVDLNRANAAKIQSDAALNIIEGNMAGGGL